MDIGQTLTETATPAGGTTTYAYSWSVVSGTCSPFTNSLAVTQTFTPTSTGTCTLKVTLSDTATTPSGALSPAVPTATPVTNAVITIDTTPTVVIAPTAVTMDIGQTLSLTATPSGGTGAGHYSYAWSVATTPCTPFSNGAAATQTFTPTATTTTCVLTVTLSDTGTSPSGALSPSTPTAVPTTNAAITVAAAVVAGAVTLSSATIDIGQTIVLHSAASGGTTLTYQWYTDSVSSACGTLTTIGSATSPTYSFVPASTGTFYFCYKVTDTGTSPLTNPPLTPTPVVVTSSTGSTITVHSALVAGSVTPGTVLADIGQTTTWTANPSGGSGSYTYVWEEQSSSACGGPTILTYGSASTQTLTDSPTGGPFYVCYTVTDSGVTSDASITPTPLVKTSTTASTINVDSAPSVSLSPTAVTMDVGQTLTITATPSGGTGSWHYIWAVASGTCSGFSAAAVASATQTYTPTGTTTNCVITVTLQDVGTLPFSSPPSSPTPVSAVPGTNSAVTVDSAPAVSISPTAWTMDVGQTKTFTATPSGGTGSYSFAWSVVSGTCVPFTNSGVATQSFSPTSTGTCSLKVTLSDTGTLPFTTPPLSPSPLTTVPVTNAVITVNTALGTPSTPSVSNPALDVDQAETVTGTIPSTGTAPYSWQWFISVNGGSYTASSVCGVNSGSGVSGGSVETCVVAGNSLVVGDTYNFEFQVTDSASVPVTTISSPSATVSVQSQLGPGGTPTLNRPALDVDQTETVSATIPSSGTSPYAWTWLVEVNGVGGYSTTTVCATNSGTGAAAGATEQCVISGGTLTAGNTYTFEMQTTDGATTPEVAASSPSSVLTVKTMLTAPGAPVANRPALDVDQVETVTATLQSTGTPTYSWAWMVSVNGGSYGAATQCTTNSGSGAAGGATETCTINGGTLSTGTTYNFELQVTDSATLHEVVTSTASNTVTVKTQLTAPGAPVANRPALDADQTETVTATLQSTGTPTYSWAWQVSVNAASYVAATQCTLNSGSGAAGGATETCTINGGTLSSGSTYNFELQVTDSATLNEVVTSAPSNTITVSTQLLAAAAPSVSATSLDRDQVLTVTDHIPTTGTANYGYLWLVSVNGGSYVAASAECTVFSASPGTQAAGALETCTVPTNTLSAGSTYAFELQVTDTATFAETTTSTASSVVTVASQLTAPAAPTPNRPLLDVDQTETITGTIPSTGTSTYSWVWMVKVNAGSFAQSTVCAANTGSGASAGATVTCAISASALTVGSTYTFELQVTDSASTTETTTSAAATPIVVSSTLTAAAAPAANRPLLDVDESETVTASIPLTGTSPYSWQWLVQVNAGVYQNSIVCVTNSGSAASAGATETCSINPSTLSAGNTYHFELQVTDGATTSESQTSTASNAVVVSAALTAPSTPNVNRPALDVDQTETVTSTVPSTGTAPYTWNWLIQINAGSFVLATQCSTNGGSGASAGATETCTINGGTLSAGNTYHLELEVTDSATLQETFPSASSVAIVVNSQLLAAAAPAVSATLLDADQVLTVTDHIPTTGTAFYGYLWLVSVNGGSYVAASAECTVFNSGATQSAGALETCTVPSNTLAAGSTYVFEFQVTDSATAAETTTSTFSSTVTVHSALTAPAAPIPLYSQLPSTQLETVSATIPATGTPTYTYVWGISVNGGGYVVASQCTTSSASGVSAGPVTCTINQNTLSSGSNYRLELETIDSATTAEIQVSSPSSLITVDTATLALSPISGPSGTTVTLSGSGYSFSTVYDYCYSVSATPAGCAATLTFTTTASGTIPTGGSAPTIVMTATGYVAVSLGANDLIVSTPWAMTTPALSTPTPSGGPINTLTTVTGTGFAAGGTVTITIGGVAIPSYASCTTGSATGGSITTPASGGSAGDFTCSFRVPSGVTAPSTASVVATDGNSAATASTTFSVTVPTLALSPGGGPIGTHVTATGTGFTFGGSVTLTYVSTAIASYGSCSSGSATGGTITATASGGFVCTFTVPSGSAGGSNTVTATDGNSGAIATATFDQTVLNAPSPGGGPINTQTTLSGTGFTWGGAVTATISGFTITFSSCTVGTAGSFPATSITTPASGGSAGDFSCTFRVPAGPSVGTDNVVATDVNSGTTFTTTFTVTTPAITVNPTSGPAGQTVTLTGSGFAWQATTVTVTIGGSSISSYVSCSVGSSTGAAITPTTGSGGGSFTCIFAVPTGLTAGSNSVVATDGNSGATASTTFTVNTVNLTGTAPLSGPVNTLVTLVGTGFAPSSLYYVCFLATSSGICGSGAVTFTSTAGGAIPSGTTITVPGSPSPPIWLTFSDPATTFVFSTPFTVTTPSLTLTPPSGPSGSLVTLSGNGYAPSTGYNFCFALASGSGCATTFSFVSTGTGGIPTGSSAPTITIPSTAAGGYFISVSQDPTNWIISTGFGVTAATLTLTPASGPVGSAVTLTGTNFGPSTTYTYCFSASATASCSAGSQFTTTSGSAIPSGVAETIPTPAAGTWYIDISQGPAAANFIISAVFTVTTATLVLSPISGPQGATISLTGTGYGPSTTYTLCFSVSATGTCSSGSVTTTAAGALPSGTSVLVPNPTTAGTYYVAISQGTSNFIISSPFVVTVPMITVSPAGGPVGTNVVVTGTGFSAGYTVTETISTSAIASYTSCSIGTSSSGTITTPASGVNAGDFTCTFVVPALSTGAKTVTATDANSAATATATYTVTTPTIALNPTSGPDGQQVTATGAGFAWASTTVSLTIGATAISAYPTGCTVGSVTAGVITPTTGTSSGGAFSCTFTLPSGVTSGAKTVTATDSNSGATGTATFTVTTVSFAGTGPLSGPVGTLVTLAGGGLANSWLYYYCFAATATAVCPSGSPSFTSTATGGIPTGPAPTITVPATNNAFLVLSDPAVSTVSSTPFTLTTATLALAPTTGPAGTIITLSGTGYAPSTVYAMCVQTSGTAACPSGTTTTLTSTAAGAIPSGTTLIQPTGVTPGSDFVDVSQGTLGTNFIISASYTVTTATLTLTPASGPASTTVTLTGSGYTPSATYTYCLVPSTSGSSPCASGSTFTATAGGAIPSASPTTVVVPMSTAAGSYDVVVSIGSTSFIIAAGFTVTTPTLSLSPATGPVNTIVTLSGTGLAPGVVYTYCFSSASTSPCLSGPSFTATGTGTIPAAVTLNVPGSANSFVAVSERTSTNFIVSAAFTVTTATLTLTPSTGPTNTLVTLTGSGYAPGTTYLYCFGSSATAACPAATTTSFTTASGSTAQSIPAGTTISSPASGNTFVDISETSTNFIVSAAFTPTTATESLTPTTGPAGTLITISGTGYTPSLSYNLCFATTASACTGGGSFTASATGAIPAGTTITAPGSSSTGSYFVTITQSTTNLIDSAGFTVTAATLVLTPNAGPGGTLVTLSGAGYAPGTTYLYCFAATSGSCASGTTTTFTTASGASSQSIPAGTTILIPAVTSAGGYFVSVSQGSLAANFIIASAFTATTPTLTATPSAGPVGTIATLSGSGYAPGTTYSYCFSASATSACPSGTTTTFTTASGVGGQSIPAGTTLLIPSSTAGSYFVDVSQGTTGTTFIDSTGFTVTTATLVLTPSSGPINTLVTLTGTGYATGITYAYCFQATQTACPAGTLTTFSTGAGTSIPVGTTISVPATANSFVDVSQATSAITAAGFTVTTPTLTISPSSGPTNTLVTLTGTGYAPSTSYTYCFSASASAPCASGSTFTSSAAGAIPAGVTISSPSTANGHVVISQGTTNFIIAATFSPTTATLTLSPTSGSPGTIVTLSGSGYAPSTVYDYCFASTGTATCGSSISFTSSAAGAIPSATTITVPAASNSFVDVSQGATNAIIGTAFTATSATLTLTPSSGPVGSLVTLSGGGYAPSTSFLICFAASSGPCPAATTTSFTTTAGGAIPAGITLTTPASSNSFVDVSEGSLAANFIIASGFTVTTASLVLTPTTGPANTLVSVSGGGYAPSTTYNICFQATASACTGGSTFTSTGAGGIPVGVQVTIPSGTTAGSYDVDVSQGTAAANFIIAAPFTVTTLVFALTPASGPVNSLVTLSGSGWTPSATYTYCFAATSGVACPTGTSTTFTASAGGAIPAGTTISVPASSNGFVDVSQGTSTQFITSAAFTVTTASLVLSPSTGPAGSIVTLSGSGYAPSTSYLYCYSSSATSACAPGTTTSFTTSAAGAIPSGTTILTPSTANTEVDVSQGSTNFIISAAFTVTTATLTLTPSAGPTNTSVTLTGTGYSPSTTYSVCFGLTATSNCPSGPRFTSTAGGAIPVGTTLSSPGTDSWIEIYSWSFGVSNASIIAVPFTPTTATLTLTPASGPANTLVTVTGAGYAPSTTYTVCFGTTHVACASGVSFTTASGSGGQSIPAGTTISIPTTAVAGGAFIDVTQGTSNLVDFAAFTVTTPTLVLSTPSGPVNSLLTLSGTGYAPNTIYTYCFQATSTACSAGATFTSTGAGAIPAATTITVPASGNAEVDVSQGASNFILSAAFSVTTAALTLTPASGPANSLVTLTGSGYGASVTYTACLSSSATSPCFSGTPFTSSASGSIPAGTTLTIPSSTTAGSYFVDVSQGSTNFIISAGFTVTTATLSLAPSAGPSNSLVTLTGSGYAPSTVYLYCFSASATAACPSGTTTTFTASATGTIPASTTISAPASANGFVDVSQGSTNFIVSQGWTMTTATLTLTPNSGLQGTTTTLSGTGYANSLLYTYCLQATQAACASGSSFTSTGTGAIPASTTLTVPSTVAAGTYYVDVSQGASNLITSASFTVQAGISLLPSTGTVGSSSTVSGTSFGASATVTVTWTPGGATLCTATSLASGAFSCSFTVPAATQGSHTVTATAGTISATATYTVQSFVSISVSSSPVWNRNATAPIGLVTLTATGLPSSAATVTLGSTTLMNWTACTIGTIGGGGSLTPSATGGLSCTFGVPQTPGATYTLSVLTGASTDATTSLTVTPSVYACSAAGGFPTIATCSSRGPVGTTVYFFGTGFLASNPVGVVWGTAAGSACPSGTTNAAGSFTCSAYTIAKQTNVATTVTANQTVGSSFLQATTSFLVTSTLAVSLSASVTTTDIGISVTFTATASGGVTPYTTYAFAFGDGGTSSGSSTSASHTYSTPGTYTVTVTVTDTETSTAVSTVSMTIHAAPVAGTPTASKASADVGQSVTFSTVASLGTSPYVTYTWSGLPNGCSGTTTTVPSITCTVTTAQTVAISVTVTDSVGATSTASSTLSFTVNPVVTVSTISATVNSNGVTSADSGQSVTFAVTASGGSGGYGYAWSNLPTGCSAGSGPSLTCTVSTLSTSSTTVTVTVTDSDSGSGMSTLLFTVYTDPTVTTPTGSPASATVDAGQSVTFSTTASGGTGSFSSYTWSGLPTGCSSTATTAVCAGGALPAGSYSISVTVTDSNRYTSTISGTLSFVVQQDPTATAPVPSQASADVGQSGITFSTTASFGVTPYTSYTWTGLPAGCTAGATSTITCGALTTAQTYTVTVKVTDSAGVTSASSGSLTFTVNPSVSVSSIAATVNAAPVTSADSGQTVVFSVSASGGSGGFSYAWSNLPTGCSVTSGQSISCTVTTTTTSSTTLSVLVTDSDHATGTASLSFTVFVDPTVATPSGNPASTKVDAGQSVTFTTSATGGTGTYTTYTWSNLPTGCSSTTSTASCSASSVSAGTYSITVTVTDSNKFTSASSATLTFVVDPDPTVATPSGSPSSVDVGQSVTFSTTAASGSGGFSYVWNNLPAGCSTSNAKSVTCSPTASGSSTITVTVTDSNSYSVTSGSLSYTVDSDPTVTTPTASKSSVDVGQSVTFSTTGSGGSGGLTYVWSGLPSGCASSGTSSVTCQPSAAGSSTVTVTVTDSNSKSVSSGSLSYVVDPDPTVSPVSATRASADVGQGVTFSATAASGSGGFSYVWSNLPTGCVTADLSSINCASVTAAGTYSVDVQVTDSNGGQVTSGALPFTVYADPSVPAPTASSPSVDVGQSVTFQDLATGGSGGFTYAWTGLCAGSGASVSCTASSAGPTSEVVVATDSNGVATAAASLSYTVYAVPTLAAPSASASSIDVGQSVTFTTSAISTGSGGDTISWASTSSTFTCVGSGLTVQCTATNAGTYSVNATVTDSNGGTSTVGSLAVTVLADPTVSDVTLSKPILDLGQSPAQSTTISVTATGGTGSYTYLWSNLPTGCPSTTDSFTCTPTSTTAATSYSISVTVTDSNGFKVSSTTAVLTIYPALSVTAIPSVTSADTGTAIEFTATPSGGTGSGTYTIAWDFGDGATATGTQVSHSYSSANSYTVTVSINDSARGSATSSLTIKVSSPPAPASTLFGLPTSEALLLLLILIVVIVAVAVLILRGGRGGRASPREFEEPRGGSGRPPESASNPPFAIHDADASGSPGGSDIDQTLAELEEVSQANK